MLESYIDIDGYETDMLSILASPILKVYTVDDILTSCRPYSFAGQQFYKLTLLCTCS